VRKLPKLIDMGRRKRRRRAPPRPNEKEKTPEERLAERRLFMEIKKTLKEHLKIDAEPLLSRTGMEQGLLGKIYKMIVGNVDKARQNPLNWLGGVDEVTGRFALGDVAIQAYWDNGAETIRLLGNINGSSRVGTHYTRVSPTSDEGVMVIGGIKLTEDTSLQYRECWEYARGRLDLSKYKYSITFQGEKYDLDLKAFSRVLRHPKTAVACHHEISEPIPLGIDMEPGFLMDEIRKLENAEIKFYDRLPESMRDNGGMAEVETPFNDNLFRQGVTSKGSGCYVEVKLDISSISEQLLPFTVGTNEWRGTRKGFAEIFSGFGGMRFLNTFLGKARANRILTPIAKAMDDLKELGIKAMPIAGGYLQYWVDMDNPSVAKEVVEDAIKQRINAAYRKLVGREEDDNDPDGYLDIQFDPRVAVIEAKDMPLADVRARFILDSLGKSEMSVSALERADFLLNFVENISNNVQKQVYNQMSQNGGRAITDEDMENIGLIRWVCSTRRTIRDVEDLAWTLREDDTLHDKIKSKRAELEEWVFKFSKENFERMFELLLQRVQREIGK
jgi:hypothetical protein